MKVRSLKLNKGYTLIEILIILAIILILASIVTAFYRGYVNRAKDAVCQENLKVLNSAVKLYLIENEVLPAVLGDLKLEHLEKAYAKVIKDRDWFTKFSHFLLKLNTSSEAYAQFLTYENLKKFGMSKDVFKCPFDVNGGASYGINGNLSGKGIADINEGNILIGDSDNYVFVEVSQLKKRHRHGKVAIAVSMGGEVKKIDEEYDVSEDDGLTGGGLKGVADALQAIIDSNIETPLADKVEDALAKAQTALEELDKTTPDNQAAVGNIEGAVGDLEAAVNDGLLDSAEGNHLIDQLESVASQLAQ